MGSNTVSILRNNGDGTLKVIGNEIKSGVNGINYNYGVGYLEVVNNVIRDNSGRGMYLYGVSGGVARGNLVSGNGSGVYPQLKLITDKSLTVSLETNVSKFVPL